MQAIFDHLELGLGHQDSLTLRRATAALIKVSSGSLWITRDGDPRDHILEPGQAMRLDGSRRTVVAALSRANFSLIAERPVRGVGERMLRLAKVAYIKWARRAALRAQARRATPAYY